MDPERVVAMLDKVITILHENYVNGAQIGVKTVEVREDSVRFELE